jgi:hypothetical protein
MSQKQARRARQTNRPSAYIRNLFLDKRAAATIERRQALELERQDLKAEGKLSPARHLLSRLNYLRAGAK